MFLILGEQAQVALFKSKHIAVVHAQTTRMQHKTSCEKGHLDDTGVHRIWMDKKKYALSNQQS